MTFQAHPNIVVTLTQLRRVVERKHWAVRMQLFDCGHYVTVSDDKGKTILSRTWRCGDDTPEGPSQCAISLVMQGKLQMSDFDNVD